ncbi:MAG: hypothetical protein LBU36_03105 [Clostridiales bacterium]|nr:hypothetical protein [Clostridiales bacterium]
MINQVTQARGAYSVYKVTEAPSVAKTHSSARKDNIVISDEGRMYQAALRAIAAAPDARPEALRNGSWYLEDVPGSRIAAKFMDEGLLAALD